MIIIQTFCSQESFLVQVTLNDINTLILEINCFKTFLGSSINNHFNFSTNPRASRIFDNFRTGSCSNWFCVRIGNFNLGNREFRSRPELFKKNDQSISDKIVLYIILKFHTSNQYKIIKKTMI